MTAQAFCTRHQLLSVCQQLLEPWRFKDYCPNGLQIEGKESIAKIALAVTANQAAIEAAINWQAQALIVHHGLIWKGEEGCITGFRRSRLKLILNADLNVLAYHLPLDAHLQYGNNIQLAHQLNLLNPQPLNTDGLIWTGDIPPLYATNERFINLIDCTLHPLRKTIAIFNPVDTLKPLKRIAWCTGGGGSYFETAIAAGVDVFLTGEANEQHVHIAKESGVSLLLAGHHATERYGIQALGQAISQKLAVETLYFDIDSPL